MGKFEDTKAEIIDEIVEGLSVGTTLREMCRMPGMPSWRTVYDWINADADTASRIAHARELGYEALAEQTLDIADNTLAINEHIQKSKLRIDTRLKLLAKWSPKRYGDRATVDVGNKDGETLRVDNGVDTAALVTSLAEAIRTQKADK